MRWYRPRDIQYNSPSEQQSAESGMNWISLYPRQHAALFAALCGKKFHTMNTWKVSRISTGLIKSFARDSRFDHRLRLYLFTIAVESGLIFGKTKHEVLEVYTV